MDTCNIKEGLEQFKQQTAMLRLEDHLVGRNKTRNVSVISGFCSVELVHESVECTVMKCFVANGTRFLAKQHVHAEAEIVTNIAGRMHMSLNGDEPIITGPRQTIVIPSMTPHDPVRYEDDNLQIVLMIPRVNWFDNGTGAIPLDHGRL